MKNYLAILDSEHLENPIFLKSLAQSLAKHGTRKGVIIHGDSEYTERLIQTGMMREDARRRAILDLNRRLIALLADHGVSALGLHGFQKELVFKEKEALQFNSKTFHSLPQTPVLVLSSLIAGNEKGASVYIPPIKMAEFLNEQLDEHIITIFSQSDHAELFTGPENDKEMQWSALSKSFLDKHLSEEQRELEAPAILTTSLGFSEWPSPKNSTFIR